MDSRTPSQLVRRTAGAILLLLGRGPASSRQIVKACGVSRPTTQRGIAYLRACGVGVDVAPLVGPEAHERLRPGRKGQLYMLARPGDADRIGKLAMSTTLGELVDVGALKTSLAVALALETGIAL